MAGMFASMISMSDIRSVIMALYFVIIAAAVIVIVHDLRDPVKAFFRQRLRHASKGFYYGWKMRWSCRRK